jgi:hypothetical protein
MTSVLYHRAFYVVSNKNIRVYQTFLLHSLETMDIPPTPPFLIIPPIPVHPTDAIAHVLEHIVSLNTQSRRDRVIVHGSVTPMDDLPLNGMDSLLDFLTNEMSVMAKTRLKTLKMWEEEHFDIN